MADEGAGGRSRREARGVRYREYEEDEVFVEPKEDRLDPGRRRSGRVTAKENPLDALVVSKAEVVGAPDLRYSLGGAETGGVEADKILKDVEDDESIIRLQAQFINCRRIVLHDAGGRGQEGRVLAAAVVEFRQGVIDIEGASSVLEIPIFAAAKIARQQGNGSMLLSVLLELAINKLGAALLVVSAVDSSRRFWMRQGLHAMSHCAPPVATALRALRKRGDLFGFFETTQMAMALPTAVPPGTLVTRAREKLLNRREPAQGVSSAKAAELIGYEDLLPSAAFFRDVAGKRHLACPEAEGRAVAVPHHKLQAFPKDDQVGWGAPGWGVRSLMPIKKGMVVLEFSGEWLTDEQYGALSLPERSLVVGLDERVRERKRRAGETLLWLNLQQSGSLARLVNECPEAPNLELQIWPMDDAQQPGTRHVAKQPAAAYGGDAGGVGRRLYLVAKHDVPALQELYWERLTFKRGPGGRPVAPRADSAAAAPGAERASPALLEPSAKRRRQQEPLSVGSYVEVRMTEAALLGARYGALVLAAGRADGLMQVEYTSLYESEHTDQLQVEWIRPVDVDEARPEPPNPPDGWHQNLHEGDQLELSFEGGWWPVKMLKVVADQRGAPCADGTFSVVSSLDEGAFAGLKCTTFATRLRPAWRWQGRQKGGGWNYVTSSGGLVQFDASGRPLVYPQAMLPAALLPAAAPLPAETAFLPSVTSAAFALAQAVTPSVALAQASTVQAAAMAAIAAAANLKPSPQVARPPLMPAGPVSAPSAVLAVTPVRPPLMPAAPVSAPSAVPAVTPVQAVSAPRVAKEEASDVVMEAMRAPRADKEEASDVVMDVVGSVGDARLVQPAS